MINFFLVALIALHISGVQNKNKYCKIDCGMYLHTVCMYKYPCITTCRHSRGFNFLSDSQRQSILDTHNAYRNTIAKGQESRAGFAGVQVSNMTILSWSKEAEYIASCVVRRCDFIRDKCRTLNDGMTCGQNMLLFDDKVYQNNRTRDIYRSVLKTDAFNHVVDIWYEQIADCGTSCDYRNFTVKSMPGEEAISATTQFSQIIWAETKYVGCAYMIFKEYNINKIVFYCNYCPAGNQFGEPYFLTGDLDPDNCARYDSFPYLCGEQRKFKNDLFKLGSKNIFTCVQINVILSIALVIVILNHCLVVCYHT